MILAALALAAPAHAAFPGANGKIAYQVGGQQFPPFYDDPGVMHVMDQTGANDATLTTGSKPVWSPDGTKIAFDNGNLDVMNADGSGSHAVLTPGFNPHGGPARLRDAAWSPDGTKLAFIFVQCDSGSNSMDCFTDLQTVNADGTGRNDIVAEGYGPTAPAWSPDGSKIAFLSNGCQLLDFCPSNIDTVSPNGGAVTALTSDASADTGVGYGPPDWSPDGSRLIFDRNHAAQTMNADGSGVAPIAGVSGTNLVWSPDGRKIAFATSSGGHGNIATANPDGSGQTNTTSNSASDFPDWQPIPQSYVRPRGAGPFLTYLVPAYNACTVSNRTHGAPLAFPSCSPPVQTSGSVTIGTPEANGAASNSIGSVLLRVRSTSPSDVVINVSITDVRCLPAESACGSANTVDGPDYTGELQATTLLRMTDRQNQPDASGGSGPGTVEDVPASFTVPCSATVGNLLGSRCVLNTTANAIEPGWVVGGARSIWQLDQVKVYDGGADGVASTTGDNTLFMDEGIFIP